MRSLLGSTLALTIALAASVAQGFLPAPHFTLDLGKTPEDRWVGAVEMVVGNNTWEHSFHRFFEYQDRTVFQNLSPLQAQAIYDHTKKHFPMNHKEMHGIAKGFAAVGHPEVDVRYLSLWFWWHELAHGALPNNTTGQQQQKDGLVWSNNQDCTGILALPEDPSLPIYHGRNLDQATHSGRNMTMQITAINSSASVPTEILYQAIDIYWFTTGFVTANAVNKLTLEENWRSADYHAAHTLDQVVNRIIGNETATSKAQATSGIGKTVVFPFPQVFMFRHVLETLVADISGPMAFTVAMNFLNSSTYAAPYYGIMSGAGRQGAVISTNWEVGRNVVALLNDDTYAATGEWHMVQTNYDRWNPAQYDIRRWTAHKAMESLGRLEGASRLGVWMAIGTYPVHNAHTMYSVAMDVTGWHVGYKRQAMRPDPDFGRYYEYSGDQ